MLYLLAIILAILIGKLTKGRVSNLMDINFEKPWLFIVAFVILIVTQIYGGKYEFINNYIIIFQGLIFCLLIVGFWFNRKYIGIWVIGAGCLMNAVTIFLNGGKMPVSLAVVEKANLMSQAAELTVKHAILQIDGSTKLPFLCDIIYLPNVLGFMMKIVSIGDLIVVIGLFLIILQLVMGWRIRNEKSH